jgi:gamma-glutamyltranspeptidase / glutathione hydrolase
VDRTSISGSGCLAVASRREAVDAGLRVMGAGGNAVDAAVAMAFTAAVVEPSETSLGGSGFMLVHDPASGSAWSIEFGPRAPLRAAADMFEPLESGQAQVVSAGQVRGDANATGALAPCVPGAVAGLCLAAERFGERPLAQLLEPAIACAEDGFEIDAYLTLQLLDHLELLRACPHARAIFLPDGRPPIAPFALPASDDPVLLRQPQLGRTLRGIADAGADWLYRGPAAAAIERAVADRGGLLSREDLASYEARVEEPLRASYRGWSILAPRAPSGAWTALEALQILDRLEPPESPHVLIEALQLAFADRYRFAGDASGAAERLLSQTHADELAARIRPDRSVSALAGGPVAWAPTDAGHGTTHLCAIDAAGRTVTCTFTLGDSFGARLVAGETGVLLDGGMAWFEPVPGRANSIAPRKRPLVNMSPLLLVDGDGARAGLGASGGRRIISAVVQVASAIIDRGLDPQPAISAPRLDASEHVVRLSERLADQAEPLRELGHEVALAPEQHQPLSFELARPAAAAIDSSGRRSGGIHQLASGFVAALD